jgi:hypothetical protein
MDDEQNALLSKLKTEQWQMRNLFIMVSAVTVIYLLLGHNITEGIGPYLMPIILIVFGPFSLFKWLQVSKRIKEIENL